MCGVVVVGGVSFGTRRRGRGGNVWNGGSGRISTKDMMIVGSNMWGKKPES